MFHSQITIHNSKPSDQTGKASHFEPYPQPIHSPFDVGMCTQGREIVTAIRLSDGSCAACVMTQSAMNYPIEVRTAAPETMRPDLT